MRVAKDFTFEAAHRIPWHEAGCRNLHGHSYKVTVALEGPIGAGGMVIDFKEIKSLVKPIVDSWDHSTLVAATDLELLEAMDSLNTRVIVLPFDTTAENLCAFLAEEVRVLGMTRLLQLGIDSITVTIRETETGYAELTVPVLASVPVRRQTDH